MIASIDQNQNQKDTEKATGNAPEHITYNIAEGQKTSGEKWFDLAVYGGVGYLLNLGVSLALTEWMLHRQGNKLIWQPCDKILTNVFKSAGLTHEKAATFSHTTQEMTWLTTGGHFTVILQKPLEDNKAKLVYLFNRTFFPNAIKEDDPYRNLTAAQILDKNFDENCLPQPIKEQPKQTWLNVAKRRLLAQGITLGTNLAIDATYTKDRYYKNVDDAYQWAIGKTGSQKLANLYKEPFYNRMAMWTVVDGINTVITSVTHYLTNGAHVKTEEEKMEEANIPHHPDSCLPHKESKHYAPDLEYASPKPDLAVSQIQGNQLEKAFSTKLDTEEGFDKTLALKEPRQAQFDDGYASAITKQHHASGEASLAT